jgi:glucose/arabinose dehydrogenase
VIGNEPRRARRWTVALVTGAVVAACSPADDAARPGTAAANPSPSAPASPTDDLSLIKAEELPEVPPPPPGQPDLASVSLKLTRIATLVQPSYLTTRQGDDALYVSERLGTIRVIRDGVVDPEPMLDISADTTTDGERGFLGFAFSPDGERLYVSFTDLGGDNRVDEFDLDAGLVDLASRRTVLTIDHPYANHNGGSILFGPLDLLYLGFGDGGGSGDPNGNGQSLGTMLGKILRIDPVGTGGAPYVVPPSNPFVGQPGARAEIWGYGLRNPWRFSFDRTTNDVWIADVGQDEVEEVNFLPATEGEGANYGWNLFEGSRPFLGKAADGTVAPLTEYSHDDGRCSITGGYVYRGSQITNLQGAYLYGDFCDGRLHAVVQVDGRLTASADLGVTVDQLVSFGQDAQGELYALSLTGDVLRLDPA